MAVQELTRFNGGQLEKFLLIIKFDYILKILK
jgi:hypothetical protein